MPSYLEIAGVSLARPAPVYQASHSSFGVARLRRSKTDLTLRQGTLEIDLAVPVANRCGQPVDRVAFPIWSMLPHWVRYRYGQQATAAAWRSLIVDHRLFSRPELILSPAHRSTWKRAPDVTDEERIALDDLAERYRDIVQPRQNDADADADAVECDACSAARMHRLEQERASRACHGFGRSLSRRSSSLSSSGTNEQHPQHCVHYPVACMALDHFCQSHHELVFEVLGLLQPGGDEWARNAAVATEHRFLLGCNIVKDIIGQWLLDETPYNRHFSDSCSSARGHRSPSSGRRSRLDRRSAKTSGTADPLPEKVRHGLANAAAFWGIQAQAEDLVLPVPSLDSEGENSAPFPVLGGSKPAPLATIRLLPELPPPSPPPRSRDHRRRRPR
ncbi:MAG: hypothetical protein V2A73_01350 [Pseudomonadota bacterium]